MSTNFIIEEFDEYKVLLFSHNTQEEIQYGVELDLPDGKGILRFVTGDLPQNSTETIGSKKIYYVYYHVDRYLAMIDILRNEKPLFFYYNHDNHESYVTTSGEPVGEAENSDD